MKPVLQLDHDQQSRFWTANDKDFKADYVSGVMLDLVGSYVGKTVLDVGAANGSFLKAIGQRYGGRVEKLHGIDLAPRSPEIEHGDATNLKFTTGSFDTILFTDVIEHLGDRDLDKALSEIGRVLSKGGHVIANTINNEDLHASSLSCPSCGTYFHKVGHCQVFSERRCRDVFKKHGMDVVWLRAVNLGLLAKHGWKAKLGYALGVSSWYKPAVWSHDLLLVARKA